MERNWDLEFLFLGFGEEVEKGRGERVDVLAGLGIMMMRVFSFSCEGDEGWRGLG